MPDDEYCSALKKVAENDYYLQDALEAHKDDELIVLVAITLKQLHETHRGVGGGPSSKRRQLSIIARTCVDGISRFPITRFVKGLRS